MSDIRYGKPCMTNLPKELFDSISYEMKNTEFDRTEVMRKSIELKLKAMNMEMEKNESSK